MGKEFALSGSEQNPDLTGKDVRLLLSRTRVEVPAPVQAFLDRGEDFVGRDDPSRAGGGHEQGHRGTPELDLADDRERGRRARPGDRNPFTKDCRSSRSAAPASYLGDKLIRVAAPHRLLDPDAGPLVAVRLNVLTRKTLGGLETDLSGRVLRPGGEAFPGLYAAGEMPDSAAVACTGTGRSRGRSWAAACSPAGSPAARPAARCEPGEPWSGSAVPGRPYARPAPDGAAAVRAAGALRRDPPYGELPSGPTDTAPYGYPPPWAPVPPPGPRRPGQVSRPSVLSFVQAGRSSWPRPSTSGSPGVGRRCSPRAAPCRLGRRWTAGREGNVLPVVQVLSVVALVVAGVPRARPPRAGSPGASPVAATVQVVLADLLGGPAARPRQRPPVRAPATAFTGLSVAVRRAAGRHPGPAPVPGRGGAWFEAARAADGGAPHTGSV